MSDPITVTLTGWDMIAIAAAWLITRPIVWTYEGWRDRKRFERELALRAAGSVR